MPLRATRIGDAREVSECPINLTKSLTTPALPHRGGKKLIYTVRAVTSGTFTVPPVEAGAMYDPTLWARGPGGTAVVAGPWTGKLL